MDIKLEGDQIKEVVTKAILDSISTIQKEELIKQAINHLITEQTRSSGYGSPTKFIPLHEAFNQAAKAYAVEIAKEWLLKPENKAQLEAAFGRSMGKILSEWEFGEALATAVRNVYDKNT